MRSGAFLATVGQRVRSAREQRRWSRRELSQRSGVSERFLAQLETGQGNISLVRFAEVAAALGTTPAELLAGATGKEGARPIARRGQVDDRRAAGAPPRRAVRRDRSADRADRRAPPRGDLRAARRSVLPPPRARSAGAPARWRRRDGGRDRRLDRQRRVELRAA